MRIYGIILAAGRSTRFGQEVEKQYLSLLGKPVIQYSIDVLQTLNEISGYIIVADQDKFSYLKDKILPATETSKLLNLVPGGRLRCNSVMNGLNRIKSESPDYILIHDSARPMITADFLRDLIEGAKETGACIPGLKVTDTIKYINEFDYIESTPDRRKLFAVQTPQVFKFDLIYKAYTRGMAEGFEGTDDASYLERLGRDVRIIPGLDKNIKITYPMDLKIAGIFLEEFNDE